MKTNKILALFCILFINFTLSSQIIYIDIPDTVLLLPPIPTQSGQATNFYDFDINNDSCIDLTFELYVHKCYWPEWQVYEVWTIEQINPKDSLFTIYEDINCMKKLEQYDTIDMNQSWSPNYILISGTNYFTQSKNKYWICNPSNSSKYCGIKFINNGNIHYGWIRLSWNSNYVVVYDYAFNATPDLMILAGQTGLTEINEILKNDSFTISHIGCQLEITSKSINSKIDRIRLIGISGQCIRDIEINNFNASINTSNIPTGIYILQITQSENIFVQKIFIK